MCMTRLVCVSTQPCDNSQDLFFLSFFFFMLEQIFNLPGCRFPAVRSKGFTKTNSAGFVCDHIQTGEWITYIPFPPFSQHFKSTCGNLN